MNSIIIPIILGVFIIFLGISNIKGNISSLHWYHRQRVTEENIRPFGQLVGISTIIIGAALILYSILSYLFTLTQFPQLETAANILLISALVLGLGISFYGMIKYNKGIF